MATRVHDHLPAVAVGRALAKIPRAIRPLVACEFVIGVDPVFAGVHTFAMTHDGRAYSDTPHCVYDFHQEHRPRAERGVKVILPTNPAYRWDGANGIYTVVHELGHVLHQRVGFDHVATPITEYAKTNHHEAFAEAFAGWIWGDRIDEQTEALFDGLVWH